MSLFTRVRRPVGALAGTMLVSTLGLAALSPAAGATTVNTGAQGSVCQASAGGLSAAAVELGTSTGWLSGAPAYYETGLPTGQYAGKAPKGIMLTIHGGGFYIVGPGAVAAERPVADQWRKAGWATINISYTACSTKALRDVEWFYDAIKAAAPNLPICADGSSAGGTLALLLAGNRPLSCVISRDGPTDLTGLATGQAYDPTNGLIDQTAGPAWVYNLAVAAFGVQNLAAMSPVTYASHITARVLQAPTSADDIIPGAQETELDGLLSASPWHLVQVLAGPGPVAWVHASITTAAAWQFVADLSPLLQL